MNLLFKKARVLALIFVILSTNGLTALTLDEFIAEVKAANPSLSAAHDRHAAQTHRVRPAGSWADPFIAGGPDEINFNGLMVPMVRYQVNQTIPFPGKSDNREKLAALQAATLQADSALVERDLVVNATQLYLKAVLNERALVINDEYIALLRDSVASEKIRYNTGSGGHHLWLLAMAEIEILQTEKLRLKTEANLLFGLMHELRNKPPESPKDAIAFSLDLAEEKLPTFDEMLEHQPEYKSVLAQITVSQENIRQSKLGYLPDIMVQGMVMQSMMDNRPSNWGTMVGVTMPIHWYSKQNELLKASEFENQSAEKERTAILNRIKTEWFDARQQLQLAIESHELYQTGVLPKTKMAVDSVRAEYRTRNATLRELVDTMRIYKKQQLEAVASRLDIELARLRLKELITNQSAMRLSPRTPTLFNGMNGSMNGGSMNDSAPMRPARGMRPPGAGSPASGKSGMGGM